MSQDNAWKGTSRYKVVADATLAVKVKNILRTTRVSASLRSVPQLYNLDKRITDYSRSVGKSVLVGSYERPSNVCDHCQKHLCPISDWVSVHTLCDSDQSP